MTHGELEAAHQKVYQDNGIPPLRHWRVTDTVLAGRNPLTELDVVELRDLGITHVLDLREESEWRGSGREGQDAVVAIAARGIERLAVEIPDGGAPTRAAFTTACGWLEAIHQANPGARIYVHCRAGLERTAVILAAWLGAQQGLSAPTAISRLGAYGYPGNPLFHQSTALQDWLAQCAP